MPSLAEDTKCPVCDHLQAAGIRSGKTVWFHCYCDTLFHTDGIDPKVFSNGYLDEWKRRKNIDVCFDYLIRTYAPLVEELTYGRRFLDVGFTLPTRIKTMNARGWLSTGIDLVENDYCKNDFETFNFKVATFDFILMGHVLQSLKDPVKAIQKSFDLLNDRGILMITMPSPELSRSTGPNKFGHWNAESSWIYISNTQLQKITTKAGFRTVYAEHNVSRRFGTWNDLHLMLVKE